MKKKPFHRAICAIKENKVPSLTHRKYFLRESGFCYIWGAETVFASLMLHRFSSILRTACLLLSTTLALPSHAETGVAAHRILLGESAAFSGPAAQLGIDLHAGAKLDVDSINQRGGLHGRKIDIVTADDKYEPELAAQNTRRLNSVAAKIFVAGLRRAGPDLTRDKLIIALESINLRNYDIGFPMEFSLRDHRGSRFVDMTIITRDGKFLN